MLTRIALSNAAVGRTAAVCLAATLVAGPASGQGWFDRSPSPPAPSAQAEIAELSLRIDRLEELVRRLNGEIEELRFQVQGGAGGARAAPPPAAPPHDLSLAPPARSPVAPEPAGVMPLPAPFARHPAPAQPFASAGQANDAGPTSLLPPSPYLPDGAQALGAPPQSLGTIPGTVTPGAQEPIGMAPAVPPVRQAAIGADGGSEQAYNDAYGFLLQQDFAAAEYAFSQFLVDYPDSQLAGNAQYWLAESFYARGEYRRAAQEFLEGYQTYPGSIKAPDSLLKLGMTLAALGQKDQACASLAEIATKFPGADQAVHDRAAVERQRAGC